MRMVDARVEVRRVRVARPARPAARARARSSSRRGSPARWRGRDGSPRMSATSCPGAARSAAWHPGTTRGTCTTSRASSPPGSRDPPGSPSCTTSTTCSSRPAPAPACRGHCGGWSAGIERRLVRRADLVVTVNDGLADHYRARVAAGAPAGRAQLRPVVDGARPATDADPGRPRRRLPTSPSSSTTASWTARAASRPCSRPSCDPDLQRAHLVLLGAGPGSGAPRAAGGRAALRWPRPPAGSRPARRTCCPGWRRRTWARCRCHPRPSTSTCRRRTSCSSAWRPASRSW